MLNTILTFVLIAMVVVGILFLVTSISKGCFKGKVTIRLAIWKLISLEVGVDKKNN